MLVHLTYLIYILKKRVLSISGNFDALSNAITPTVSSKPSIDGYQQSSSMNVPNPVVPSSLPPVFNINDLFQKLVASGFVTTNAQSKPEIVETVEPKKAKLLAPQPVQTQITPVPTKTRRTVCDYLKPISFDKPETLKVRQSSLYGGLYSGMQCSSCGMRFSPEASMQYSQHLDWHFRQNRKGKRSIRVASSRRWYYSLADWKNYEELEDLEERGK